MVFTLSVVQLRVLCCLGRHTASQAPFTSPCPPSNHAITLNLTLTFAASWFDHPGHVV